PEVSQPVVVVLIDGTSKENVERAALRDYRRKAGLPQFGSAAAISFYDTFWKPLEPSLTRIKRIYVSTDGVLNQVSLGVMPYRSGKFLLDRYDLQVVNSTKDLLRENLSSQANSAVLIGDPDYGLGENLQRDALAALHKVGGSNPVPVESADSSVI